MLIAYLADYPQHLPILADWHHAEWGRLNPGQSLEDRVAKMQADLQKLAVPTTFVALDDAGALMGSASLVARDMQIPQDLTPWLASVYVHPDFRRRGIASALVQRVIEEARALGVGTLYLYTEDQERLYARLGWREMERREYMGYPVVIMELRLRNAAASPEAETTPAR